jgi:molybdopterin-guanine dinucleotide biosynthesis protein A
VTSRLARETIESTAIVLAGGRSSRFGSDKLKATINGRTILEWAVARVAVVCDEVIVALAVHGEVQAVLPGGTIQVHDTEPHGGPLLAVLSAARVARGERLLVVGGDMPSLVPLVLCRLVEELGSGFEAVALGLGSDDRPQPLPLAVGRSAILTLADEPLSDPGSRARSLHAILDRLATLVVPEASWRPLDPDAASLRDVDVPADLLVGLGLPQW